MNQIQTGLKLEPMKSADRNDTAFLQKNSNVKKNDGPSFNDTLKKVVNENPKPKEENEAQVKEISDKIDSVEKKIEILTKNPDKAAGVPVEELKKILEKIKGLLDAMKNGTAKAEFDGGKLSMDMSAFLNGLLDQITMMLNNPNMQGFKNMLDFMNQKTDETVKNVAAAGKTNAAEDKAAAATELSLRKESKPAETSDTSKTEKVKIIDKRTETPVKAKNEPEELVLTPKEKAAKTTGITSDESAKNTTKDSNKENTIAEIKPTVATQESLDLFKGKDLPNASAIRAEYTQNVSIKQAAGYGGQVTKAQLDALMQNVTGNALVTLRDGKSEMKMNLTPPELGRMNMKFTFEDGQLMGKIVVSSPEAKALFDQNLGDLQRALQQAGVLVNSLDVTLGGSTADNAGDNQSGQNDKSGFKAINTSGIPDTGFGEDTRQSNRNLYDSRINFVA